MERHFSEQEIRKIHRDMLEQVADVLLQYINISKLALMGFAWKAIANWEKKHNRTAYDISIHGTLKEKAEAVREMFDDVEDMLRRILRDPEQAANLKEAVDAGYKYYLTKLQR